MLSVPLRDEADFLLARQRAKQIAGLLGFEPQDQTRIATAVSEIARNALEYAGGGRVEYSYDAKPVAQLRIVIEDEGKGIANLEQIWAGSYRSSTGMGIGLTGTRRLLDEFDLVSGETGTRATLVKYLPDRLIDIPTGAYVVEALAKLKVSQPAALQQQNQELLGLLGELRAREVELERLNQELEETNRGVLVLYAELEDKAQTVQQASEMKTRFLSGVTHELRTPLNSIVSLSRLLLLRTDGDLNPEQEKQVQFILRSAHNLSEMVNDLLDMAKIEAGKATIKLSEFRVSDTLAGLRGMFRPLAINERVQLIFEMPERPIYLKTDEGKLAQILRNFISNALKFTEEGSVTVSAKVRDGDGVVFSVSDTGVGIASEHFDVVMQEWGQVEGAASGHKQRGSGLGLPLSHRFAELLGGQIWFESKLGMGSTFYLSLPARVEDDAKSGDGHKTAEAVQALPRHVVVADDDEVSRYLLRRRLATLTTAPVVEFEIKDGKALQETIAADRPRLLLLDVTVAGARGGIELARRLRSREETADLPIVAVSGRRLTREEEDLLAEMQIAVISKRLDQSGEQVQRDEIVRDSDHVRLERALLQVGLSNLHEARVDLASGGWGDEVAGR